MIDAFLEAGSIVSQPETWIWITAGILLGIFLGAIPGIGGALGMALVLPLTIPMDGVHALILLVSIYSGALYGGSIAAILINTPGTGAAAATTLDGYPMSRSGQAITALAASATASAIGGFFAVILLLLLSPLLIEFVLLFGSPEYFLIAFLGLCLIVVVARGSIIKGLIAGTFGLLLSSVGLAPNLPETRYTFGHPLLFDGISFIAVLIGLFAVAEMLKLAGEEGGIAQTTVEMSGSIMRGVKEVLNRPYLTLKSGLIGVVIGAVPGAGATVSTFVSYSEAIRSAPDLKWGTGIVEGVVACESANNGTGGGSLVPTLSFGIPGSASTAVLLGGLIMHGVRPGPNLFTGDLHISYALFLSLFLGNFIILGVGLGLVTRAGVLTKIDTEYIIPVVFALAVIGSFAIRTNWIDIGTVFFLGVFGVFMKKYNYSIIAFVLGVVLGPIAEENLVRSLRLSEGSWLIFVQSIPSIILILMTVLVLVSPLIEEIRN